MTPAGGTVKIGDLTVARLGFGAMRILGANAWGQPKDRNAALTLLRKVVERGTTLIDTADSYGPHSDEELIAAALHPYPKGLLIATKGGLKRPSAGRWDADCRPAELIAACEGSLKRLKLERIDLYQLHTVDPNVPLDESLGALVRLQQQGKIRHIGVSNFDTAELARARKVATVVSVQNHYNLGDRSSDPVVDVCARDGLAFLPWYPVHDASRPAVERIARQKKASAVQIALAWLLKRSPAVAPIPGTSSLAHFEENWAAQAIALSDEEFRAISAGR